MYSSINMLAQCWSNKADSSCPTFYAIVFSTFKMKIGYTLAAHVGITLYFNAGPTLSHHKHIVLDQHSYVQLFAALHHWVLTKIGPVRLPTLSVFGLHILNVLGSVNPLLDTNITAILINATIIRFFLHVLSTFYFYSYMYWAGRTIKTNTINLALGKKNTTSWVKQIYIFNVKLIKK